MTENEMNSQSSSSSLPSSASSVEHELIDAKARLETTERALERLNNLLDNYGIPRWPYDATKARLQRMYRAWNVPGADVSLTPYTTEQWAESSLPSSVDVETRFAELISTELDHYAQKIAKRVLRKALGGKIAERSSADNT